MKSSGDKMKIPEFGTLQMVHTDAQHYGAGKSVNNSGNMSFKDYLLQGLDTVSSQQNDVSKIQDGMVARPARYDGGCISPQAARRSGRLPAVKHDSALRAVSLCGRNGGAPRAL